MKKEDLTTQYPITDEKEDQSKILFLSVLPGGRYIDTPMDGKRQDFDGYMQILDKDRRATGNHFNYQLKSTTNRQKNYIDCKRQFLNGCKVNGLPVFLILVNLKTNQVFWELIDEYYIKNKLKLKRTAKYKRVKFKQDKAIVKDDNFLDKCLEICKQRNGLLEKQDRYNEETLKNPIVKDKKSPLTKYAPEKLKEEAIDIIEGKKVRVIQQEVEKRSVKKDKKKMFQELYYLAFVYLLEKLYIDKRGEGDREKIRGVLSISKEEENTFLEKLKGLDLIEQTHNLLTLKNKTLGRYALNELVENEVVQLDNITSLF